MKSPAPQHIPVLALLTILGTTALILPGCNRTAGQDDQQSDKPPEEDEHETVVHLDSKQLAAAQIESLMAGPGIIEEILRLAARVASNENTVTHINPRVEGIVRAIHKGLGDRVKLGEPLAELESVELGFLASDYLKAHATLAAAEETLAKAQELFKKRLETLEEVFDGEIDVASKIFDREKELQEKGISTLRPFLEADKALQQARLAKKRETTTLLAERDTRLLELEVALRQGRIAQTAARYRLQVLGLSDKELLALPSAKGRYGRIVIRAPRDGVVVARHITESEHVDTNTTLFEIHDLSVVWILASAYEKDLTMLRCGQKVIVQLDALPGVVLTGNLDFIDYRIAMSTRAVTIRIELENRPIESWPEEFPLRPGMFGSVDVVTNTRTGRVVIPESAIVHEGEKHYVFIKKDAGTFHREAVTIREGARGLVEIIKGVNPGDEVVVKGSFVLKSIARSGDLGEGHGH